MISTMTRPLIALIKMVLSGMQMF